MLTLLRCIAVTSFASSSCRHGGRRPAPRPGHQTHQLTTRPARSVPRNRVNPVGLAARQDRLPDRPRPRRQAHQLTTRPARSVPRNRVIRWAWQHVSRIALDRDAKPINSQPDRRGRYLKTG
jgi:hypothetical protein